MYDITEDYISTMNLSINIFDESVEREIVNVFETDYFRKEWKKLTKFDTRVIKEKLIQYFDINNPVLKEAKYSKKFPLLSQARKLRWNSKTNKASNNGDLRIINAYIPESQCVILLLVYSKSDQEDITEKQARIINETIDTYKKGEI